MVVTILCLHGEGGHPSDFDCDFLSPHAQMIWLKLPGFSDDGTGNEIHDLLDNAYRTYPNAYLLGHSYGAYLALAYAHKKRHVKKLKLILVSPGGIFHDLGHTCWLWACLFKFSIPRMFCPKARGTGNLLVASHIQLGLCTATWDRPALDWIPSASKVWFIFGEYDTIAHYEDGEILKDLYPDCEFRVVRGSSHNPFTDQPEQMKAYLYEIIKVERS